MFSEDYKRGVCLDDLDVGLDWNALIIGFIAVYKIRYKRVKQYPNSKFYSKLSFFQIYFSKSISKKEFKIPKDQLSSFCEIENLECFLRITEGVSVWMIWMLDLIGTH